jgi:hypothetical protein
LDEGSAASVLNEEGPAIMAEITLMADEDGRACKTPSKWAIPVTTNATLIPCRSGNTSARQGCGGGRVNGLVSARAYFDRRTPIEIPTC